MTFVLALALIHWITVGVTALVISAIASLAAAAVIGIGNPMGQEDNR